MKATSTILDFDTLSDQALIRLRRRNEQREWKDAVPVITKVANALVRLKVGGRNISVKLEVPAEIGKALRAGTMGRTGSVVRSAKSGRFLKHLKEVKPSQVRKLLKSPMVAFVIMDALQSALLNEKLAAIEQRLKEIDRKLEAQNQGLLFKAIEQMRDLPLLKGKNKWQRLHQVQDTLRELEGRYLSLTESRWQTIASLHASFERSRFTNDSETQRLCTAAQEITKEMEMAVTAKILHARLTAELGETRAAEQEVLRLHDFILTQNEKFYATFGDEAPIQSLDKHHRIFGRNRTGVGKAQELLVEPVERLGNLLNSALLLHLALPESAEDANEEQAPR